MIFIYSNSKILFYVLIKESDNLKVKETNTYIQILIRKNQHRKVWQEFKSSRMISCALLAKKGGKGWI